MSPPAPVTARLRTGSLRRRVTLLVLGLLAVLLAVLAVGVDFALDARLHDDLRGRLADRAEIAAALVREGRSDDQVVRAVTGDTVQALLETPDGRSVGVLPEPPARPAPPDPAGRPVPPPAGRVVDTGDAYVLQETLPDGARLTLVADQRPITETLARLRWVLGIAGAVVLLLATGLVALAVEVGLRPLARMTGVARSIGSGDRGRRLRPDHPGTELGRTARAFDDMLDALEGAEASARRAEAAARRAEAAMRDLLSDAAHELRSPVAAARASVETALRTDPPRVRREELLAGAVRELGRSGRLVADLLEVTRLDAGDGPPVQRREADLLALARETADAVTGAGPRITVTGGPAPARVDPDRIRQVLDNLLRNAVRAAGPDGTVRVTVSRAAGRVAVDVEDDGPGVPAAERERVFDRLVRLDTARGADGGAGLGLPIARGLARAHGGDVQCLPTGRGAWFRLTLPDRGPVDGGELGSGVVAAAAP